MNIAPYSLGIGDRFARQGEAQLAAFLPLAATGTVVVPVWNKSRREHTLVGTTPDSVAAEAAAAVKALGWKHGHHVDADHIGLATVDPFLAHSDFFTLDVAEQLGEPVSDEEVRAFAAKHASKTGELAIPGIATPFRADAEAASAAARKYLAAIRRAGEIYRKIAAAKGEANFIAEVSMDETDRPQTPGELWFILAGLADEGVRVQTIAPRFSGAFHKGVEYVGDPAAFAVEFEADVRVCQHAVRALGLPASLKLSVHSGSDKFALYPHIRRIIRATGAGVHVKTAGTTWLEEVTGLAQAGGDALRLAKEIYARAHAQRLELAKPYASVIHIDFDQLPDPKTVAAWDSARFVAALAHDQSNALYDPEFRQMVHVAFRIAAELGAEYTDALAAHKAVISRRVTENIRDRHLNRIFA